MKKSAGIILLLIITFFTSFSQKVANPSFRKLENIENIFTLATKEKKPVFLEAYLPTCHHCMAYDQTLKKAEIKNYLDKNFHAYQLDLSQKEANAFLRKHKIYIATTPTFLVFSPEGKVWNIQAAGEETNNVKDIIGLLNRAKDPTKRQQALVEGFDKGVRNLDDMVSAASFTRLKLDTTKNIEIVNELVRSISPNDYENKVSFLIVEKLMMDEENPLFEHLVNNMNNYTKDFDTLNVKQAIENTIMTSLYNKNATNYSEVRFQKMKNALAKIGVPEKQIAARFIYMEVMKDLKNKQFDSAISRIKSFYGTVEIPLKEKEFWCKTVLKYLPLNSACPF
ncbi:MAG: thioredoxin family protein [Aquirufa sp.]